MEEDFYATIKFKSGEEIFSKVSPVEEDDRVFLLLDSPVTIERVKTRGGGMYGYKLEPWLKTSKDDLFVIDIDDILTLNESNDIETISMHRTFASQQNTFFENREKKLNRKMN